MNNYNPDKIDLSKEKLYEIFDYAEPSKIRCETYKDYGINFGNEMLAVSFIVSLESFRMEKLKRQKTDQAFRGLFTEIVEIGRTASPSWDISDVLHKLSEEHGEYVTTIQIKRGKLPHKTASESEFGEAADMINCIVDGLSKMNPTMSPDEIVTELQMQVAKKSQKWKKILEDQRK